MASLDESVMSLCGPLDSTEARLADVAATLQAASDTADDRHGELLDRGAQLDDEPVNEVQALLQLPAKIPAGAPPLPDVGGWALSASTLLGLGSLLRDKLLPGAAVVVDDADRPDAQETGRRWAAHPPWRAPGPPAEPRRGPAAMHRSGQRLR